MQLHDIYIRDPFILPHDGVYYLYGKLELNDRKFVVYKSNDLKEWSEPKVVFKPPSDFWATKDFWAPEVHVYKDKFYMFASFKAEGKCRGVQILVSDFPDGEFIPLTKCPVTPSDWECLDGTLYMDNAGIPYMVFCHEWTQIGNGAMYYAKLSEDFTHLVTKPQKMFQALDYPFVESPIRNRECYVTDGPFLHRCDNGDLLLTWSSYGQNGYFINVLKSNNGEIDGQWEAQNMLFDHHGGHGMIFQSFSNELKLVLHRPDRPLGAERAIIFNLLESEGQLHIYLPE